MFMASGNRDQIIERDLFAAYPSSRKLGHRIYEVPLQLNVGVLYIQVRLGQNFPNQAPSILVAAKVVHPMIESSTMEILYPEKSSWDGRIHIVEIIKRIHNEFAYNPPQPAAQQPAAQPVVEEDMFRVQFTELIKHKDEDQVRQIQQNDQELEDFILEFPEIDSLTNEKKRLLSQNIEAATENLRHKTEIEHLVEIYNETVPHLKEAKASLKAKLDQQDAILQKTGDEGVK